MTILIHALKIEIPKGATPEPLTSPSKTLKRKEIENIVLRSPILKKENSFVKKSKLENAVAPLSPRKPGIPVETYSSPYVFHGGFFPFPYILPPPPTLKKMEDLYNLAECLDQFKKVASCSTYEGRIQALQKLGKEFWVTATPNLDPNKRVYFKICISKSAYFSDAFDESAFSKPYPELYDEIRVYEYVGEDRSQDPGKPLLQIRASQHEGELVSLNKGKKTSGTVAAQFFLGLAQTLRIKFYLFNNAQVDGMFLNAFVVGSGKDWYEKTLGVTVIACQNMKRNANNYNKTEINQSPEKYQAALQFLQKLTFKEIHGIYNGKYKKALLRVRSVAKFVFGKIQFARSSFTLQQLVNGVLNKVKDETLKPEEREIAVKNQHTLYETLLNPYEAPNPSEKEKQFMDALETLNQTRVLFKDFS